MSDFAKWLRATWPETMKANRLSERTNDLAELAAQQTEVLDEYRCSHPLGKAARECTLCIVKRAAEAFQDKYE